MSRQAAPPSLRTRIKDKIFDKFVGKLVDKGFDLACGSYGLTFLGLVCALFSHGLVMPPLGWVILVFVLLTHAAAFGVIWIYWWQNVGKKPAPNAAGSDLVNFDKLFDALRSLTEIATAMPRGPARMAFVTCILGILGNALDNPGGSTPGPPPQQNPPSSSA